jgi:hypothetical protein
MADTIWSLVALVGSIIVVGVVFYYVFQGRDDRARDEEAREYFDRHGHWPGEKPG